MLHLRPSADLAAIHGEAAELAAQEAEATQNKLLPSANLRRLSRLSTVERTGPPALARCAKPFRHGIMACTGKQLAADARAMKCRTGQHIRLCCRPTLLVLWMLATALVGNCNQAAVRFFDHSAVLATPRVDACALLLPLRPVGHLLRVVCLLCTSTATPKGFSRL